MTEIRSFYKEPGSLPANCPSPRITFDELGYSRAVARVACGKREERHELVRAAGRWRRLSRE